LAAAPPGNASCMSARQVVGMHMPHFGERDDRARIALPRALPDADVGQADTTKTVAARREGGELAGLARQPQAARRLERALDLRKRAPPSPIPPSGAITWARSGSEVPCPQFAWKFRSRASRRRPRCPMRPSRQPSRIPAPRARRKSQRPSRCPRSLPPGSIPTRDRLRIRSHHHRRPIRERRSVSPFSAPESVSTAGCADEPSNDAQPCPEPP